MNNENREQVIINQDKKGSNKLQKVLIILLMVIIVLGIIVISYLLLNKKENEVNTNLSSNTSNVYEANVILDDPESLQDIIDKMEKEVEEGKMALEMKTVASSVDGKNFTCYLGNAKSNTYDMYMTLYLDGTQEEIYRSGLLPIGGRIESFELSKKLDPGTYATTLTYNQVEEDGTTIHAQVSVGLELIVQAE